MRQQFANPTVRLRGQTFVFDEHFLWGEQDVSSQTQADKSVFNPRYEQPPPTGLSQVAFSFAVCAGFTLQCSLLFRC